MGKRDIMPWKSPLGGILEVRYGEHTAAENFEIGEPVSLVDAGTWTEPTDNVAQWTVAQMDGNVAGGIAAWGPGETTQGSGGTAPNINPATGAAYATGDWFPYWPIGEPGQLWITKNFYAADGGSAVAPALTDIGDEYQIVYATFDTNGVDTGWGIEKTVALVGVDVIAEIVDVLDARKQPIRVSGNAGVYVTFEIKKPTLAKVT